MATTGGLPRSCVAPPRMLLPGLPPLHQDLPRKLERGDQTGCCYPGLHHLDLVKERGLWQPFQDPQDYPDGVPTEPTKAAVQDDRGDDSFKFTRREERTERRRTAVPSDSLIHPDDIYIYSVHMASLGCHCYCLCLTIETAE